MMFIKLIPFFFLFHLDTTNVSNAEEPVTEIIDLSNYDYPDDVNESEIFHPPPTKPVPHTISSHSHDTGDSLTTNFPQDSSMYFCSCDLTSKTCDINCCCDPDCEDRQKRVFSTCQKTGKKSRPENKRCQQIKYFFRDNSNAMRVESNSDSFFCLAADNLKERHFYPSVAVLKSESSFDEMADTNDAYSWSQQETMSTASNLEMKVGTVMNVIRKPRNVIQSWNLPCPVFSSWCDGNCPVTYLSDIKWSCLQPANPKVPSVCTSRDSALNTRAYQYHVKFLRSTNGTDLNCTQRGACPSLGTVNTKVCWRTTGQDLQCATEEKKIPETVITGGNCQNVVRRVKFTIGHSGADGVDSVEATFDLESMNTSYPFLQNFEVVFIWTNTSGDKVRRSGNPGYMTGLPVLVGTKSKATHKNNISLIVDNVHGLAVLGSLANGDCDQRSEPTLVRFGYNMYAKCHLRVPLPSNQSCNFLRCLAKDLLLGNTKAEFVSSFGDSELTGDDTWLKILISSDPTSDLSNPQGLLCSSVPSHLDIQIVYVRTHTVVDPQHKIIGVRFVYRSSPTVELLRASGKRNVLIVSMALSTSITFNRLNQVPQWQFGKPPQLSGNLPLDFFYPFLMESSTSSTTVPHHKAALQVLITICILFT